MAVSVCIPTYKRHDLLAHCLETVFASQVRPLDVVVSDDAHEAALAARLAALPRPAGVELRYVENHLGRRQAANVRNAFAHARHEPVVLMHDDDFFLPGGLDALWRAWQDAADTVDAVFGRQRVVADDGTVLADRTARWNAKYRRLEPGRVACNLCSALTQQFPMNGMLLRRSVVEVAGVPDEAEVGHHTDLHFGIRYALAARRPFVVIAEEVSAYRLSATSIRRSGGVFALDGDVNYAALERVVPRDDRERRARRHALDGAAGRAVLSLLARGERRRPLAVYGRHWRTMRVPPLTRLKLVFVVAGALAGVRWSEATLRQPGLGLPDPRRWLVSSRGP
jgi:GT2 family glycosyltransferase